MEHVENFRELTAIAKTNYSVNIIMMGAAWNWDK
jgi:hypothetical protein